jgi:hypothetical protein
MRVQMAQAKEYGSPVNGANTLFLLSQPAVNGGPIRCAESPVKRGSEDVRGHGTVFQDAMSLLLSGFA